MGLEIASNLIHRLSEPRAYADPEAVLERMNAAVSATDTPDEARPLLLEIGKAVRAQALAVAEDRLSLSRHSGLDVARGLAFAMDTLIIAYFEVITTRLFPAANRTDAENLAVAATGGYGRGALAPLSDIDLLFIRPYKQTSWGETVVEYLLYLLWDLRLKVGHAVRTNNECVRLARDDLTIRTAVLETRHVAGDPTLTTDLRERLWKEVFSKTGREFVEAKLAERDARHRQMGGSRYVVEPNLKESKGGLRDLQTLFWMAKYLYNTEDPDEMIDHGVFTREEYDGFITARKFLWTARCHLHFFTGRAEDRLSFDVQRDVAARMGYRDDGRPNGAVERFMKDYFLAAKTVGDLTRIFCATLEANQNKRAPGLGRLIPPIFRSADEQIEDFVVQGGRLNASGEAVFIADPVNLIRLFHVADQQRLDIHPMALRLVTRALELIDDNLRADPVANRLFLEILSSRRDPETALRRMNEAGVLGEFVPDFGRIVAMMQFNMYHHYTADEHLIRCIGVLSEIEKGECEEEHPLATRIIKSVLSREVLYVALFLHDIAKGRPEDHSEAGAQIAYELCPRLGMGEAETETVAWLVLNHLVMSDTAQKRDLADPKTAADFAALVQSPERLRLLLCLTVADIRGVGPGVFNGWKGELLRQLYNETETILLGGHSASSRRGRIERAKDSVAERLDDWPAAERDDFLNRHYDPYWLALDPDTHHAHALLMREAGTGQSVFAIRVEADAWRAVTKLSVTTPDHPGLFSRLTGALAVSGVSIVDAKIFTTKDGMALDTFWIQDQEGQAIEDPSWIDRIRMSFDRALSGQILVPQALARKRVPVREKAFRVAPQVHVDNAASETHTVMEINGLDRPGLLYDLTRALIGLNVRISSAQIATFGERAVDVFYVKDAFGLKITAKSKIEAIRAALLAVIPERGDDQTAGAA